MPIESGLVLVVTVPLAMAGLAYLLGRYAIRVILYALWAAIVVFGAMVVNSGLQATGDHAGMGQFVIFWFIVCPTLLVAVIAGVVGILRARRVKAP